MGKLYVCFAALLFSVIAHADDPPEFIRYKEQMLSFGAKHCSSFDDPALSFDSKLLATYYDAEWVFLQIADFTGDSKWVECAKKARGIYRDKYVIFNNGAIPGYWVFPHGLSEDFLRLADEDSKSALQLILANAAYVRPSTNDSQLLGCDYSRENAYAILAMLQAKRLKIPVDEVRLQKLRDYAFGHLDQWFVSKTAPYVRPFMVGLTAQALIEYEQISHDPRTLPQLKLAADAMWAGMWAGMWIPSLESFMYTDRWTDSGGQEATPDLNLLVAPLYAWVYKETDIQYYRDWADVIFQGGVRQAYLTNAKQFNQNYRWSFKYLEWRDAIHILPLPTPTPEPTATYTPVPTATSTPRPTATPLPRLTPTRVPTPTPMVCKCPGKKTASISAKAIKRRIARHRVQGTGHK